MGRVASSVDNALMESLFSTLQRELRDTRHWNSRADLAVAVFEWIETWSNPRRRHTSLDDLASIDFEQLLQTLPGATEPPRRKHVASLPRRSHRLLSASTARHRNRV